MKPWFTLVPVVTLSLLILSCAAMPTMKKWEGKTMTLCCDNGQMCTAETWQKAVVMHCPGDAKLTGGENIEKVTGYRSDAQSMPGGNAYGNVGRVRTQTVRAETQVSVCRTYACSVDVIP